MRSSNSRFSSRSCVFGAVWCQTHSDLQFKNVDANLPNRNLAAETLPGRCAINAGLLVCPLALQIIMLHQGWILMHFLVLGFIFSPLERWWLRGIFFFFLFLSSIQLWSQNSVANIWSSKIKTGMKKQTLNWTRNRHWRPSCWLGNQYWKREETPPDHKHSADMWMKRCVCVCVEADYRGRYILAWLAVVQ